MHEWFLDDINGTCLESFAGRVKCEVTEVKGRILRAQRNFKRGEVILTEPPLHLIAVEPKNEAFQVLERLYNAEPEEYYAPVWYWAALSSLTEDQLRPPPRIGSLRPMDANRQRRLISLYHEPVTEASEQVERIVQEIGLESASALFVEELLQVWILNCFEHTEDPQGFSCYYISSFVSHSCYPNASWTEADDASHIVKARRPIQEGDEICISYLLDDSLLHCAEERKRSLQETKLFDCTCERCEPEDCDLDACRGFRCQFCGECGVFHKLKCKKGHGLRGVLCSECGKAVTRVRGVKLLQHEVDLEQEITAMEEAVDQQKMKTGEAVQEAERLLENVGDREDGLIGPQHWLCDKLWRHLEDWYNQMGRYEDSFKTKKLRSNYKQRAYPGLPGTTGLNKRAASNGSSGTSTGLPSVTSRGRKSTGSNTSASNTTASNTSVSTGGSSSSAGKESGSNRARRGGSQRRLSSKETEKAAVTKSPR